MKKLLIVDDAAFMRVSIRNMLQNSDIEIVGEAANGLMAVKMYKELSPDVVTMDITMPEMGGIHALKASREFDPNAKVVICSAMGQKSLIIEAMEAGALNFIAKPFDEAKVIETIQKSLQTP